MSVYDPSSLGTANNILNFNVDGGDVYYRVRSRAPMSRQLEEKDLPLPFESGVSDWRTLIGKTMYVIQGFAYPQDTITSDQALRQLRKIASLDIEQADALSDSGYVPYVIGQGDGSNLQLFLKPLYVRVLEDVRQGIGLPFEIVCKVKDPTLYGTTLRTATTQGVDPTTLGGTAIYPFAYPIIYGSSKYSVSATLNNYGDMDAYPASIIINGPVNNPQVTNSATGESIKILVNLTSNSDQLVITYSKDRKTVVLNGNSVLGSVTDDSVFFKIKPGANPITLTGDSVGSGGYVDISCYDAYPLS